MPGRQKISTLLGLIAALGFALAALRSASGPWLLVAWLASLLVVLTATLGAILAPAPRRRAWLGAAIFGWGFYIVSGQVFFFGETSYLHGAIGDVFVRIHPPSPPPAQPADLEAQGPWREERTRIAAKYSRRRSFFTGTLVALMALPITLAGAIAARAFDARASSGVPATPSTSYNRGEEIP